MMGCYTELGNHCRDSFLCPHRLRSAIGVQFFYQPLLWLVPPSRMIAPHGLGYRLGFGLLSYAEIMIYRISSSSLRKSQNATV